MAFTTLNSIINRYLIRKKEVDQSNYDLNMGYAIIAARKLHVYASNAMSSVILDIDPNTNTAQVPTDFVEWGLVAGCIRGKMHTLDYRRDLCTPERTEVCTASGTLLSEQDVLAAVSSGNDTDITYPCGFEFNGVTHGDSCLDNVFALGAGYPSLGMFKFNDNKTRIHLTNTAAGITEFLLVYKSNGIKKGKNVYIDELFEEPIVSYIRYQDALDNDRINAQLKKEEWEGNYNQVKYYKHSITIQQLIKSARKYVAVGALPR